MTTVNRIKQIAKEQGRSLTYLCKQLGFTSRTYFNDVEKNNREIPIEKLTQIADLLGVTVDYLLGKTDVKTEKPTGEGELTEHEAKVLNAYRNQPEMQIAVDRLLGIYNDEYVQLYTAASSKDNRPDEIIKISKEKWEKIKNTPDTDDTLM